MMVGKFGEIKLGEEASYRRFMPPFIKMTKCDVILMSWPVTIFGASIVP